jgi:membrane protease YdiL (CAAX protease family)
MFESIATEVRELGAFFGRHGRTAGVIGLACLFLVLHEYNPVGPDWGNALVYYAAGPLLAVLLFFGGRFREFGLGLGKWRTWGLHVLVVIIVATPVLILAGRGRSFIEYYTIADFSLWRYLLPTVAYLSAWEYIYRGFLLFGLKDKLGEAAVLVQLIPFVLLHIGKPELETVSTILMGAYFGYVAYRGNSVWPAILMHVYINVGFRVIVNGF